MEDRFFERGAERVLRFRFPGIAPPPPKQRLDRVGIDLLVRDENDGIDVAVQCKGFSVTIPGDDQVRQAKKSIEAFAASPYRSRLFVFLHNRDGRAKDFEAKVKKMLDGLVAAGKCDAVEFLDIDRLLSGCRDALRAHLAVALRLAAKRKLAEFRQLFEVTGDPLLNVPAGESELFFHSLKSPELRVVSEPSRRNISDLVQSRSESKFTLLIGNFGTGKSTTGLLAASASVVGPTIIFAECAYFSPSRLGSGLSVLLEEALRAASVFDDFSGVDQEMLRLASPLLREIIGPTDRKLSENHEYIFLLDGLDENRLYARPEGMAILMNSIADIHCPIMLTTRREHFIATFENMKLGNMVFSEKHGWKKPIRVFTLEPWQKSDIQLFVEGSVVQLIKARKMAQAERLKDFLVTLNDGTDKDFYGALSSHPLFLRLILDDVANHGVRRMGRARLILEWSLHKIRRDIAHKAKTPEQGWQFEPNFPTRIMTLMEEVAMQMTTEADGCIALTESIDADQVGLMASGYFPTDSDAIVKVALNSLLVPHGQYQKTGFNLHFVFRIFHEFFLASYAVRRGLALNAPGTQVADLMAELKADDG